MPKRARARDVSAPEWVADAIRGFRGSSVDPTEHFIEAAADRVWKEMIAHGLHPYGIGSTRRYSNVPVIAIPIEIDSE